MFHLAALSRAFIGQNIHFATYLFVALACFTAGWLYFDAHRGPYRLAATTKYIGFFFLAAGFLLTGALPDHTTAFSVLADLLKLIGYASLIFGNLAEPIQTRPHNIGLIFDQWRATHKSKAEPTAGAPAPEEANNAPITSPIALAAALPTAPAFTTSLSIAIPVAALTVCLLFWRRATTGLERHLRRIALTFAFFTLAEILSLSHLWESSDDPAIQGLIRPLSPLWICEHLALVTSGFLLIRWVWRYLAKQPLTQFFLMTINIAATIVLITTISITSLLIGSVQRDSLTNLETATKVLDYALGDKTAATRATAEIIAQNPALIQTLSTGDHTALATLTDTLLAHKQATEAIIVSATGQVLYRASDPERYSDSLAADPLVTRTLVAGLTYSSIVSQPGALAPSLIITTAAPVTSGGKTIGAVLTSQALDNAFVDGIKHATGLDSTIYAGNTRTASTLTTAGTSRAIGVKETAPAILTTTLNRGQIWRGTVDISNRSFLAIYLPLKNINNATIGMLSISQPESQSSHTSEDAIRLTYLNAIIWLILLIVPIYFVSRQIVHQLK